MRKAEREALAAREAEAQQVAATVESVLLDAGWEHARDKRTGEPTPFLIGTERSFVINGFFGPVEHSGAGGTGCHHTDPVALAHYLVSIGEREAQTIQAIARVSSQILDTATEEARSANPELFSNTEAADPEKEALREQVSDLQRQLAERVVEVPVAVEPVAAAPEPDGIPDNLRSLMLDGEPPVKFTERMRRRFRALKHLQMDGTRPTNARTFLDMSEEEIQELNDLEARGAETVKWLDVQV